MFHNISGSVTKISITSQKGMLRSALKKSVGSIGCNFRLMKEKNPNIALYSN